MYIIYIVLTTLLLLEELIQLQVSGFTHSFITEPVLIVLYLIASIGYLYKYRRANLFCFETIFLLFNFLIIFYDFLVISATNDSELIGSLFGRYDDNIRIKTLYVSVIAAFVYLVGSCVSERNFLKIKQGNRLLQLSNHIGTCNLHIVSKILTVATMLYFVYLYATGYISTWFRYSGNENDYTNTKLVFLTVLCLSSTIAQFLQYAGDTFSSIWVFIKKLDKIYILVICLISVLLILSGNRNEVMYIVIPVIVCYSILIKNISNLSFFFIFIIGFISMVIIGLTRQTGVLSSLSFDLYNMTRDFGYANINSMYLIQSTDTYGCMGFTNGLIALFSSIPFLGGFVVNIFDLEEFTRSAIATTEGMNISYTGLGTSLVGDTYYTGGIIFTILYFYLLGRLMSYLHGKFVIERTSNIYTLVIYSFMVSNAMYCLRSEWYTSFRYIGFSIVLLYIVTSFFKVRK